MRKFFLAVIAVGAAALLVGCGSSATTGSSGNGARAQSTRPCWVKAAHELAVDQAKVFLGPAVELKTVSRGKIREVERLDQGSDWSTIERYAEGKRVVVKVRQGERYLGPTVVWLRATKARCGL
jgi:hypothetical protein